MALSTKKNGPASVAADQDRGSSNPPKDIQNMKTDTTAAGARQVLDYRDLESELHNAVSMSEIACDMFEQAQGIANRRADGIVLCDEEVRLLSFAIHHASSLAHDLMKKWKAVHDSNVAANRKGASA